MLQIVNEQRKQRKFMFRTSWRRETLSRAMNDNRHKLTMHKFLRKKAAVRGESKVKVKRKKSNQARKDRQRSRYSPRRLAVNLIVCACVPLCGSPNHDRIRKKLLVQQTDFLFATSKHFRRSYHHLQRSTNCLTCCPFGKLSVGSLLRLRNSFNLSLREDGSFFFTTAAGMFTENIRLNTLKQRQ